MLRSEAYYDVALRSKSGQVVQCARKKALALNALQVNVISVGHLRLELSEADQRDSGTMAMNLLAQQIENMLHGFGRLVPFDRDCLPPWERIGSMKDFRWKGGVALDQDYRKVIATALRHGHTLVAQRHPWCAPAEEIGLTLDYLP